MTNKPSSYFFVVPLDKTPSSTNLVQAKVSFIRLVLEGGQQVDASKEVTIESTGNTSEQKKQP